MRGYSKPITLISMPLSSTSSSFQIEISSLSLDTCLSVYGIGLISNSAMQIGSSNF